MMRRIVVASAVTMLDRAKLAVDATKEEEMIVATDVSKKDSNN